MAEPSRKPFTVIELENCAKAGWTALDIGWSAIEIMAARQLNTASCIPAATEITKMRAAIMASPDEVSISCGSAATYRSVVLILKLRVGSFWHWLGGRFWREGGRGPAARPPPGDNQRRSISKSEPQRSTLGCSVGAAPSLLRRSGRRWPFPAEPKRRKPGPPC